MIKNFLNRVVDAMHFSVVIGGLGDIFALWQRSGARERGIIALVFAPMFICIGGMFFSTISFIIFVLPSFVLRFLGWLLLTVLFGAGGKYFYEKLTGKPNPSPFSSSYSETKTETTFTDVSYTEVPSGEAKEEADAHSDANGREEIRQRWYERVRGDK